MAVGSRRAEVKLTADPTGLRRGLGTASGALAHFARGAKSVFTGAFGQLGSFLKSAFNPLGRGISLFEDQIGDVMDYERGISRLAISQGLTNDQMDVFREKVTKVSEDTGVARNEILRGVSAYQALTGDTKGATAAMSTFARVAQATGSSVEDISATSAALVQNLKIDPKDLESAFSILNIQGKAGAVELHDLAGLTASLAAQFQRFKGGAGLSGLQEMGGAVQIIRRNFGSAGEAATGFQALMASIVKRAGNLEKAGIKVYDVHKGGKKTLKDFATIVREIGDSSLIKDPTKLSKALGGRGEALAALQALTNNWQDFKTLVDTTDVKSIGRDLNQYVNSPAGQLEQKMNALKLAAASAFTPERIEAFAAAMAKAAAAVDQVVAGISAAVQLAAAVSGGTQVHLVSDDLAAQANATSLQHGGKVSVAGARSGASFGEFVTGQGDYDLGKAGQIGQDAQREAHYRDAIARQQAIAKSGGGSIYAAAGLSAAGSPAAARAIAALTAKKIGEEMAKQLAKINIALKVDGTTAAAATANARGHRSHPK